MDINEYIFADGALADHLLETLRRVREDGRDQAIKEFHDYAFDDNPTTGITAITKLVDKLTNKLCQEVERDIREDLNRAQDENIQRLGQENRKLKDQLHSIKEVLKNVSV